MRADTFANSFNDMDNTAYIYDDGFVVIIACSTERQKAIAESLFTHHGNVEVGRSADGFQSAFVVVQDNVGTDGIPDVDDLNLGCLATITDNYLDQRWRDCHTLAQAEELAGKLLAAKEKGA